MLQATSWLKVSSVEPGSHARAGPAATYTRSQLVGSYQPIRLACVQFERTAGEREAEAAIEDGVCYSVVGRLSAL